MTKEEKIKFLIITLMITCLFEIFIIIGALDLINDKTAYINGLLSDKKICTNKLDSISQDYTRIDNELQDYKRMNGELDE